MTINVKDECLKNHLNQANPNGLPNMFNVIQLGNVLRSLPVKLVKQAPAPDAGSLATVDVIVLPDDAKASNVLRCTVRAGGATGEFTDKGYGVTPTTTTFAVTPNGDIAFLHAGDLVTDVDVLYVPDQYDIVELTLPVAVGLVVIPAAIVARGVLFLMEATLTAGTVLGKKGILVPAAGLPATTTARLTVAKDQVQFNNATDAGTMATVKLAISTAVKMHTLLGAITTVP